MREKIYRELKCRPQQKLRALADNIGERQENVMRVLQGMISDEVIYKSGNGFYRVAGPMPDSYTMPHQPLKKKQAPKPKQPLPWGRAIVESPAYKAEQEDKNQSVFTLSTTNAREHIDNIRKRNQEKETMKKGQKPTPAEEAILNDATVFGAKMREPAFVMPQLENYYLQIGIIENMVSQMGDCLLSENMKLLEKFLKDCVPIWENNNE